MPILGLALLLAAAAPAQDRSVSYTYDPEGRPMEGSRFVTEKTAAGARRTTEMARDVNGRFVPRESVEERVVSKDDSGTVVERIIQRYDPNGNPLAPERIRAEQRKLPDGTVTSVETRLRADLNGNYKVAEVVRTVTETSDGRTTSQTSVERPGLNDRMEVVEKQVAVEQKAGQVTTGTTTTLRRGPSGGFITVQKQLTERVQTDGRTTETVTLYDGSGMGGLEPIQQTVASTEKRPDGSLTTRVDLYTRNAPAVAVAGKLQLREQQLIEKVPTATGAVETVSLRQAQPDGTMPKGSYRKVAERTCVGECR